MRVLGWLLILGACSRGSERRAATRDDASAARSGDTVVALAPVDATAYAAVDAPPDGPVEKRVTCENVTAIWKGDREDGLEEYSSLWFEIDRGPPIQLKTGEMFFSDWSFDIFSPDCKHVLLLYSHMGPYHIVATKRLAAYLRGGKPDHVLAGKPDPKVGTGVFREGVWLSNDEVSYQWGCCDPPVVTRFKLPK